jgi:hypothetical protein
MAAMKELREPQSYPESRLPPGVQALRRPSPLGYRHMWGIGRHVLGSQLSG